MGSTDAQSCLDVRVTSSFCWKCLEWRRHDRAWPFRSAPLAVLRFRPGLQTCHVTQIRLKLRCSLTNTIVHPPVFTAPWCDLTPERLGGPVLAGMRFSPHQWGRGRSGCCDADDGCQWTCSPAHLCPHNWLLFERPPVLTQWDTVYFWHAFT